MSALVLAALLLAGCTATPADSPPAETAPDETAPVEPSGADVEGVRATGADGAWVFAVTLRSPDTGCERYADWWELAGPEGGLVYRRILNHSHPDEQPFERSGDPVDVTDTTELVVRAHMNDSGYGGAARRGSIAAGFAADPSITADWAAALASEEPLPTECWY